MRNPFITLANAFHHDTSVVRLSFEKDFSVIAKVKTIEGAVWSQSRGFWYNAKDCFNTVFSNHNLEQGMDLRFIQELLGHESSKTTEIYTHVSKKELGKIVNPLDDFG